MRDQSGGGKTAIKPNTIDRVIEWAAPNMALRRLAARVRLRQYAAAKSTRLNYGWTTVDSNSNDIISSSQTVVRSRVRQLVRDFPYFARAINVLVDLTVGSGIDFQARVKKGTGAYNKTVNDSIEYAFNRWSEQADISGKQSFNELIRLSERSEIETGESLFIKRQVKGRYVPYALQAIEPDRLADYSSGNVQYQASGAAPGLGIGVSDGNGFFNGIEYNLSTGEPVAYHIQDDGYRANILRVPADMVIHSCEVLRPGQMRGISPFACAVLAADDLSQYLDATIDTAKLAAKYLAFVTTSDVAAFQGSRVSETDDEGTRIEDMENALIEYLQPGETVNFANHNIPNGQFDAFTKFVLRMVSIATGTSFELLTGDYSGLSYSNLKAIRADLVRGIKTRFDRRKIHFCQPAYRSFLEQAVMAGRVSLPGYYRDPYEYEKSHWIWQGMESPDPLRDGKAAINLMDKGLMSPQEYCAARGRDFEEVLDEIAEAQKLIEQKGVILGAVSVANANSPGAVDGDTNENRSLDMNNILPIRKRADADIVTRSMPVTPASLDKATRSIDVTMATEAPVEVLTYEYGIVREVLLMQGCEYPERIPLLDTHDRYSSKSVLGSVGDIRVEGDVIVGRVTFASTETDVMTKVEEGHLTGFSAGYRALTSTFIKSGETRSIGGRDFSGPLLVTERWKLKELSICPIGADDKAKARAENQKHKEINMDKKTREMLIARGLPVDATDDQAWAYFDEITRADKTTKPEPKPDPKVDPKPADPVNPDQIRTEAAKMERERVVEIMAMGQRYELAEDAKKAVDEGDTVDSFRQVVLAALDKKQEPATPAFRTEIIIDSKDKFRAAGVDSLLVRGGMELKEPAPGAFDLAGFSLRELARESLIRSGIRPETNVMKMVGRAMSTDDFPYILANVANKFLAEGYETAEETWKIWCATGSVSDYKMNYLVRASETDDLEEVPEGAEYRFGDMTESREYYQIAKYGKRMLITREAIINDDLGALNDVPRKHGEAAARKVGDLPYAVLTANAAMGDGVALFNATHANIADHAAVNVESLAAGIAAMKLQTDLQGLRRLNIRPQYYLGPVATEGTVEQFFNTGQIGGETDQPNLINPYAGSRFTRVYEPRLDDDDETIWYLAGPKGKTVKVFFLNGQQTPYLEMRQGFSVDAIEHKVRIEAVAKAVDWKALFRNDAEETS